MSIFFANMSRVVALSIKKVQKGSTKPNPALLEPSGLKRTELDFTRLAIRKGCFWLCSGSKFKAKNGK
jgi:hypothetical protein